MALKKVRVNACESDTEYLEIEVLENDLIVVKIGMEDGMGGTDDFITIEKQNLLELLKLVGVI
jgi:hypothetical protein